MKQDKNRWYFSLLLIGLASSVYAETVLRPVPLELGKLVDTEDVACPEGVVTGAVCKHTVVRDCKDVNGQAIEDKGLIIAVAQAQIPPQQDPKGTVILHSGGNGHGIYGTNDFGNYYISQGYNVVQMMWDLGPTNQGWNEGANGVVHNACRPATVFDALYKNPQAHAKGTAFCGQGTSGGSAALGYALAYYANSAPGHTHETQQHLFDFVNLTNGPATARFDVSCAPEQTYKDEATGLPKTIDNCNVTSYARKELIPAGVTAPVYTFTPGRIDPWEGTKTCGSLNPAPSTQDIQTWARDGNVSTSFAGSTAYNGVFNYPKTNVSFYFCGSKVNNQSLAMGKLLAEKIVPLNKDGNGLAPINCFYTGKCINEQIYQEPEAIEKTKSDMLSLCVFNHQE